MFSSIDGGRPQISSFGTSQGARRRCVSNVDGGHSRPLHQHPRGSPLMFSSIDSGRFQISSFGTNQGAHRQCFLALMMSAPEFFGTTSQGVLHHHPTTKWKSSPEI
jgi:hypothetical protein